MLRAIILGVAFAAALVLYFSLTLYVFPQLYQSIQPHKPEAVVTNVGISEAAITLGQAIVISVNGTNTGENADMQIVSIGFPNLTRTDSIEVLAHNFAQTPILVAAGRDVGSGYAGTAVPVKAQYASVEAFSRPWAGGRFYTIDLQVKPEVEGTFAIFVKSVAFPHSWDGAHWPQEGVVDPQQEFVEVHYVEVTKP